MKKTLLALLVVFGAHVAHAQSILTPITQGLVWTPTQWTEAWEGKQDYPATTAIPALNWTTGTRPGTPCKSPGLMVAWGVTPPPANCGSS